MFKTMIAGALLTLGAGVAIGQTEAPAADVNADATVTSDVQATAKEDPAPAANTDAAAKADVQATAKEGPAPAADATANTNADAKADAADSHKAKKAKAKAECLKINVGKPRDC